MNLKGLAVIAFILLSVDFARADLRALPSSVDYLQSLGGETTDLSSIDRFMKSENFETLSLAGQAQPLYIIDWADRAYIRKNSPELIILKAAVKTSQEIELYRIYSAGTGFLVHIKAKDDLVNALYFSQVSLQVVSSIVDRLKQVKTVRDDRFGSPHLFGSLTRATIPKAHAAEGLCEYSTVRSSTDATIATLQAGAFGCVKGVFAGVWNGSLGGILELSTLGMRAFSHPIKSMEAAGQEVRKIASFIADFPNKMGELKTGFETLPAEVRAKIICEAVATVGTSIVIPGMLAKSMGQILLKVAKLLPRGRLAYQVQLMARSAKAGAPFTELEVMRKVATAEGNFNELMSAIIEGHRLLATATKTPIKFGAGAYELTSPYNSAGQTLFQQVSALESQVPEALNRLHVARSQLTKGAALQKGALRAASLCSSVADVRDNIDTWKSARSLKSMNPVPAKATR